MRYRLRTLMIVLAVGPPLIAAACFDPAYFFGALTYFVTIAAIRRMMVRTKRGR